MNPTRWIFPVQKVVPNGMRTIEAKHAAAIGPWRNWAFSHPSSVIRPLKGLSSFKKIMK